MKISSTSARLKEIMNEKGLKQVDILIKAKPFCEKYGVRLGKNDLSQYINGKFEPGQEKLTILGLALDVNEAWLMGYDVEKSREKAPGSTGENDDDELAKRIAKALKGASKETQEAVLTLLEGR
jgi:transcriptional regulator with XRE-family HTH domain